MQSFDHISLKDKKYFEVFFKQHYQPMCYFAFSFVGDQQASEDIVQNVFTRLLDDSNEYENEQHLKNFIYKSIRNECINELKKRELRSDILDSMTTTLTEESDLDLFHLIVRSEIYREILDAVNSLPQKCSAVFKLAYLEHLDNQEIAEKLSISINTVKSQKNNAKKQLREQLKHLYPIAVILLHL